MNQDQFTKLQEGDLVRNKNGHGFFVLRNNAGTVTVQCTLDIRPHHADDWTLAASIQKVGGPTVIPISALEKMLAHAQKQPRIPGEEVCITVWPSDKFSAAYQTRKAERPPLFLMTEQFLKAGGLIIQSQHGTKYRLLSRVYETIEAAWDALPAIEPRKPIDNYPPRPLDYSRRIEALRDELRAAGWTRPDPKYNVWQSPRGLLVKGSREAHAFIKQEAR